MSRAKSHVLKHAQKRKVHSKGVPSIRDGILQIGGKKQKDWFFVHRPVQLKSGALQIASVTSALAPTV